MYQYIFNSIILDFFLNYEFFSVTGRIGLAHIIWLLQECRDISNEDPRKNLSYTAVHNPEALPLLTTCTILKLVPVRIISTLRQKTKCYPKGLSMGQLRVWVPFPLHKGSLNDTSPKLTIKAFTLSSVNAFQSGQPHARHTSTGLGR